MFWLKLNGRRLGECQRLQSTLAYMIDILAGIKLSWQPTEGQPAWKAIY